MFVVNLLAITALVLLLAVKYDKSMVEMLPISVSLLILVLYILAFFGGLRFIDIVSGLVLLLAIFDFARCAKDKRKELISKCLPKLRAPSFWVFTVLMVMITIGVSQKLITWWDDYNFWGTDVKAIFYSDGFAAKYHNVQPEFGDYPPATQLMKWFFLHMNPDSFNEGLMFAGYYFMLFSFIAPILKFFDSKKIYSSVLAGICMIAFPACVEAFHLDGCCADICMATCFGYFLISLYEMKSASDAAVICDDCTRMACALTLCVMSLCKDTSFIWLLMAFAVTLILIKKDKLKTVLYIFVPPTVTLGSWYAYCLLNRRMAKLVSNSLKMATGQMGLPEYRSELLDSFVEGFVKWPLHRYSQGLVNLSPLMLILIMTVGFILLGVFKRISRQDAICMAVICPAMGIVITGILLIAHLTVFATEDQYLEPFAMVSSIERYGAPFGIGMLMLLIYMLFDSAKGNSENSILRANVPYILVAAFILLTTDFVSLYRGYYGYRDTKSEVLTQRDNLINQDIVTLNNILDDETKAKMGRVLYVRDFSDLSWISHAYISYETAPLSMVYDYVDDLSVPVREATMRGLPYLDENGYKEADTGMSVPAGFGGGMVAQNSKNGYDALLRKADELHADYIYMDRKLYSVR